MKTNLLFLFFLTGSLNNSIAAQISADTEANKNQLLLGLNITQCAVGDFELYASYLIKSRHAITLGMGYDNNFLDFGKHWSKEDQGNVRGIEGKSNDPERYFWGKGPAIRIIYDYNFPPKERRSYYFLSATAIFKIRNYSNYYFGDQISYSESSDQTISGFTLSWGRNNPLKRFVFHYYIGAGIRHLESAISRLKYDKYNLDIPAQKFLYTFTWPSFDFGFVFYLRTSHMKG